MIEQEADTGQRPRRRAEDMVEQGVKFKIGSFNVNSLFKPTMHKQVEQYMEDRKLLWLCLHDTKVAKTTQYVVGDLLYVLHGHGAEAR